MILWKQYYFSGYNMILWKQYYFCGYNEILWLYYYRIDNLANETFLWKKYDSVATLYDNLA